MSRTLSIYRQPTVLGALSSGLGMAYRNRGLIRRAGRQLGNVFKRRRMGSRAQTYSSGGDRPPAVTQQYDASAIYRRRRTGRRTMRRVRSFKRAKRLYRAIQSSDVPNSVSLRQSTRSITHVASVIPDAIQSLTSIGFGDKTNWTQIFDQEALDYAPMSEDTIAIRSGACELKIANGAANSNLIVDVYEMTARKNISISEDAEVADQFTDAIAELTAGTISAPTSTTWGITPFDAGALLKYWKIDKVTRLNLAQGQESTIERTMKMNSRRITGDQVYVNTYLKGMKAFLLIMKGEVNTAVAGGLHEVNCQVRYNQTWHYEVFQPSHGIRVNNP